MKKNIDKACTSTSCNKKPILNKVLCELRELTDSNSITDSPKINIPVNSILPGAEYACKDKKVFTKNGTINKGGCHEK